TGIAENDRVVWIRDGADREPLNDDGRFGAWTATGQLYVSDVRHEYGVDVIEDPEERVAAFREMALTALEDGYDGVRVLADNTSLVRDSRSRDQWLAYERAVDDMVSGEPLIGVCLFDRRVLHDIAMSDLACVHGAHGPTVWPTTFRAYRV